MRIFWLLGVSDVFSGKTFRILDDRDQFLYLRGLAERLFSLLSEKDQGMRIIFALISSLTFLASMPKALWACSVCFAGADQNVIWGVKGAIIILLGALLVIMTALVKFFMSIARRSKHS